MADIDYDDDELFADLYSNDATEAKPTTTEAPVKSEPEPATTQAQPDVEPEQDLQKNENGDEDFKIDFDDGNGYGGDQGGNDYGEQHNGGQNAASHPIGIKEDGKMFIGGLNWETTDESLKEYFSKFGVVSECTVMRDGQTGRSRGFGFLTFEDPKTVNTVMVKEHFLDGKIIDPKRAIPREEQERTAKIFVGGVHHDATEEVFRNYFRQFGRVIDATLMMDKDTGHPRGFGFVTFDGDEAVEMALSRPLNILGKPIEVKRAEPRGGVHDEGGRGGKGFGRGGKSYQFNNRNDNGGDGNMQGNQAGMGGQGGQNDMSGSQMAKYWFMMQQYFANMQQQMQMQMRGGQGMMNPMAMGQMNPQMMQQMQAMMAAQGRGGGGMGGMQNGMNPQMMQQMMQQQQQMQMMQQQQQQQQGGGGGGQGGPQGMQFDASQQNNFEQQKYEQQQGQRMNQNNFAAQRNGFNQGGNQTAWEGMYDGVDPPSAPPTGPRGGGNIGPIRQQRGGKQHSSTPPAAPSAPAGAPTGPRNAGKPGSNFRGGRGGAGNARGGGRYQPY